MSDLNTQPKEAWAAREAKTRPTAARLAWRLLQGHKPSATAEKHYRVRPLDLLRVHHERIEAWILEQAGVTFDRKAEPGKLALVAA